MAKHNGKTTVFLAALFLLSSIPAIAMENKAPNPQLKDLDGREISLDSFKGQKPVVLLFWTTWCPYCRKALKTLNDRYPELLKADVEVIAVNVGEPASVLERFLEKNKLDYKVVSDKNSLTARSFGILGIPAFVFLGKDGKVKFKDNYFPEETYRELMK